MSAGTPIKSERGAVVVMVAIWLPVLALFASFAIDISHFFDYSRNLQNRADAAALAAGVAYGGTCFGTGYTTAQTDVIGEAAQQYSGPPIGTPDLNLPYPYNSVATYQNQPNLTKGTPDNYHVLLNSTANWEKGGTDWSMGSGAKDSTALCSSTDEDGNTGAMADVRVTQADLGLFFPFLDIKPNISAHARVSLNAVGSENNIIPLAVRDPAEERCVEANFYNTATGQQIGSSVPLKKIGTDPNTGSVQWDNAAAPASVAIPSGANVYVQIVTGYCGANPSTYDAGSGILYINSWSTSSPASGGTPVITKGGVALTGPCPTDKLSNQYFTDETCPVGVTANVAFAPGIPYTAETVTATDTSGNGGPPLTLSKLSTQVNGDQTVLPGGLLTVASTDGFAPTGNIDDNGPANGTGTVSSFAYSAIVDATHFRLTNGGTFKNNDVITQTGDTTWTSGNSAFTIKAGSGRHPVDITTTQSVGTPCTLKNKSSGTCDLGVQTQAFGACDDGNPNLTCANPPDDSGPIVLAQLRLASDPAGTWASDPSQSYGENAFAGDPTNPQSLIVTVEIAGLSNAKPGDPPTILRFTENANNTDHATGLINCGQGPSNTGGIATLMGGCPTAGTPSCAVGSSYFSYCAPLAINKRPLSVDPCDPEGNDLSGTITARGTDPSVPVDCTGTAAGNMPPVIQGLACRIYVDGCTKNGKPNGTVCASNNWSPTEGASSVPAGDPRAITVVITAPADLASNNSKQTIPIENFAVFYITGWSTQSATACGGYAGTPDGAASDAEGVNNCPDGKLPSQETPAGQCNGVDKGMVWGFWMKYTDPDSNPLPQLCNLQAFGNCTPALTR